MKSLEEKIKTEYYRLAEKTGAYPSYLHISQGFYNYLLRNCEEMHLSMDFKKYMDMTIKRSLDINDDEFLLSFNKYDL